MAASRSSHRCSSRLARGWRTTMVGSPICASLEARASSSLWVCVHILQSSHSQAQQFTGGQCFSGARSQDLGSPPNRAEDRRPAPAHLPNRLHWQLPSSCALLASSERVAHSRQATVLAITATLSHVAVGLADGTVLLLRHLDTAVANGKDATALPPPIKPKVVHTSVDPVTGLGFRAATDKPKPLVTLFIVTTAKVLAYPCHGKASQAAVIDDVGAALHCSTVTGDGALVTARDEAMYTFGPDGREACVAYEGPKSFITAWRNSLLIISPPFLPSLASTSATVRSRAAGLIAPTTDIARVGIFDLTLNVVTHSSAVESGVHSLFCEFGDVFVLANNGVLSRLTEKSTPAKLDLLYARNLHLLAITLARSAGCDDAEVADIKRRYGDHLYTKGDYDGAMAQFLQTVGFVQPSYVIRKVRLIAPE